MRAIPYISFLSFLIVSPSGFAQTTLEQLYNSLNPTLTLPPQNRALRAMGNPKIDPLLLPQPGVPAPTRGLSGDGTLAVTVSVRGAADVAPVRTRIAAQGGNVVTVVGLTIYCRLTPAAVQTVGALPEVTYVGAQPVFHEPPTPVRPPSGGADRGLMAAGVAATHVSLLHQKGIRGAGIKVGILDFGFSGYHDLQAQGHLPQPKAVRAFGKDGQWDRGSTGTRHGTECSEIVHAMAPEADLYIASVGDGDGGADSDEIISAANWLMDQGVDIISHSGGGHFGAHNGKDDTDLIVDQATRRGILWVNSAGNEGDAHWSTIAPPASDNQHLKTGSKDFILLRAYNDEPFTVIVNWDDWGDNPKVPHSNLDFDAVIDAVDPASGRTTYAIHSAHEQNGAPGSRPREIMDVKGKKGDLFALFILSDKVSRPVRLHVYVEGAAALYPVTPERSIGSPATSPSALAVGAVNVDTSNLEYFSSQGPTDDGRAKPEISAPDNVLSEATGHAFFGTSAACPFAAGFAALVRQMRGKLPPAELARIIIASTTPLANNAGGGHGMIDAAKLPGVTSPGTTPPPSNPPPNPPPAPSAPPAGGSLAGRILPLLQLARPDNPLGVRIATGHRDYRPGDGLKVAYRAQQDAYCLVVRKTGANAITVVQPTTGQLHLTAGAPLVFPSAPQQTTHLSGPAATEQMGLICSASPISPDSIGSVDPQSLSVAVASYRIQ